MNPAFFDYLSQMEQVQPEEQTPFQSGSQSAVQAAKQSLGMDEAEKRRAQGLAMMQFAAHLGRPGYGTGSRGLLNAVNQSILPAYQTYQGEANRVAQVNAYLQAQAQQAAERQAEHEYRRQRDEERLKQRQEEQAALERYRNAQLGEQQRYHQGKLTLEEQRAKDKAGPGVKEWKDAQKYNAVPLNDFDIMTQRKYRGDVLADKKSIPDFKKAIKTVDQMKEIFKDHPNVGSSFARVLLSGKQESPTFLQQLGRKFAWSKSDFSAIQKLQKLASDLNLQGIKTVSGKMASDRFKELIYKAAPNEVLEPDGFNFVAKNFEEDFKAKKQRALLQEEGMIHGYYVPEEENWAQQEESVETPGQAIPSELSAMTSEKVQIEMPDGQIWTLPIDKVAAAIARGGKEVGQK